MIAVFMRELRSYFESVTGFIFMGFFVLLSGIFFSSDRFPAALQPFIKALPLTMLNEALRAVILEGATLSSQWLPLAGLVAWGGLSFVLALRWFRWT